MNRLNTTLKSLSFLIDNLTNSLSLYSRLKELYPEHTGLISPLNRQAEDFLNKLLKEYKRLAESEYLPVTPGGTEFYSISNESTVVECLRAEANLINAYSETMHEDVLWEVLPVLAKQLSALKDYQQVLIDSIDQYNSQSSPTVTM